MTEKQGGYIYILTSPSFEEYVKIGFATDVKSRVNQLNRSECLPFPFYVYATYQVDTKLQDKNLHKLLDRLAPDLRAVSDVEGRIRRREFFAMSPEEAYDILKIISEISGTSGKLKLERKSSDEKADIKVAEKIKNRRSPYSFSEVGIEAGTELRFTQDPSITVTVVDDRKVLYNGKETYVSVVAQQLLGLESSVQGTKYFTYNGKTLVELRDEKSAEILKD